MRCFRILLLAVTLGGGLLSARAGGTNTLAWSVAADRVSADVRNEALRPLLENIARQTGWHIFLEPGTARQVDAKFSGLAGGAALKKLLGDLNYSFVPQTNGPDVLYVFTTSARHATQRVAEDGADSARAAKHVPNQLIVKVKLGTDIDALAKSLGARVIGRDDKLGVYLLEFDNEAATDAARAKLKNDPAVEAVDYNYLYDAPTSPQRLEGMGAKPLALSLDPSTENDPCHPIVGMLDNKMQSLGPDLDPFIMKSLSVMDNPSGAAAGDNSLPTHATAMAETILQAIAQQSSHSPVKILPVDVYGGGDTATTWNVALGVKAAVDGGATVLNMSLGGAGDSEVLNSILQQAMSKGVVVFAAAGNQPVNTPTYPAAIPGVIAVTALGAPGQLAPYANFGSFVDMALPGTSVIYVGGQAYVVQGTSSATAFASGVAAGCKAVNCDSWPQIQTLMRQRFPVPAQ